jgi:hypothetical protein
MRPGRPRCSGSSNAPWGAAACRRRSPGLQLEQLRHQALREVGVVRAVPRADVQQHRHGQQARDAQQLRLLGGRPMLDHVLAPGSNNLLGNLGRMYGEL